MKKEIYVLNLNYLNFKLLLSGSTFEIKQKLLNTFLDVTCTKFCFLALKLQPRHLVKMIKQKNKICFLKNYV